MKATIVRLGKTEATVRRALEAQAAYMPDVRADAGPASEDWITAEAFFSSDLALGEFLAFEQSLHRDMDLKTAAALMMTDYGYILAAACVPLFVGFGLLPNLAPARVALSFYTTEDANEVTHRARRAHVRFIEESFYPGKLGDTEDAERFRFEIESHFQPIIEAIHRRTQLAKAALWRLVADAIAGRFLDSGRRFGNVETAKAAAMTILKVPGSPLANRQLCYFDLTVLNKNQQEFSYTFRQRGGCCRYYQIEPGHVCPTCVLKTPEERDEELRLAMRQHLGVA